MKPDYISRDMQKALRVVNKSLNAFNSAALPRERETSPNYPFADGMHFCSEHTRDSDVIQVIECRNCYAVTHVANLQTVAAIDPFKT